MTSWDAISESLASLSLQLRHALQEGFLELGRTLGYDFEPIEDRLVGFEQQLSEIVTTTEDLVDALQSLSDNASPQTGVAVLDKSIDQVRAIQQLADSFRNASIAQYVSEVTAGQGADVLAHEFLQRFIGWVLMRHLQWNAPELLGALEIVGIVETVPADGDAATHRVPFNEVVFRPEALSSLLSNPADYMRSHYAIQGHYLYDLLFSRLARLSLLRMLPSLVHETDGLDLEEFASIAPEIIQASSLPSHKLEIELIGEQDDLVECCLHLLSVPGVGDPNRLGLGIELLVQGGSETFTRNMTDRVTVRLSAKSDAMATARVLFTPNSQPIYAVTYEDGAPSELEASLQIRAPQPTVSLVLPSVGGLEIDSAALEVGLSVHGDGAFLASGSLLLRGGRVLLGCSDADSFLKRILPQDCLQARFDLTLSVDTDQGLHFVGSGGLDITVPCHLSLGPLSIESIYIGVEAAPTDVELLLGLDARAELGPIQASVERVGGRLTFSGGNDLRFGFLPPTGAGLAIEAGPIIGGGYLECDSENKSYAGILQLVAGGIGLTAIGLITTRMPDGSEGFSMLIVIGVEFFPAIQLSFGFTLSACGGLIGVNRTMVLEVLREGVRNRTLDSILFPEDPIQNAQRIISDLRAIFPPEEGRFVVGPMVRIGYGSPEFITATIAVIIELPMPIRVALLGQLAAFFPQPDNAVVELHIDVLGTFETDKKLISIDATIYDSRILTYTLTGDAALRLQYGDNPVFAMSLGGFHPKFSPPPNFPTLRRLSLSLGSGDNPRFNCDTYQALTSNSLQFGARVEAYAEYEGAKLQGFLGYDCLFYLSPFSFDAVLAGAVCARYHGHKLCAVMLALNLSGPTPWRAEGRAKIEIPVFPDVSVHFTKQWGPEEKAELPPINPWEEFVAALQWPESWGSRLPEGRTVLESLRSLEETAPASSTASSAASSEGTGKTNQPEAKPLILHPAGVLEVRQKVLPLTMCLSKFGNAPIAGHTVYDIEEMAVGSGDIYEHQYTEGYFARGQFEDLSNEEKVSKPSYELFKDGISLASKAIGFLDSLTRQCDLAYESNYFDDANITKPATGPQLAQLKATNLSRLLAGAASRRSPLAMTGRKKYARIGKAAKVAVAAERYIIVRASDMSIVDELRENDGTLTRMGADQVLRRAVAAHPELEGEILVVQTSELAA